MKKFQLYLTIHADTHWPFFVKLLNLDLGQKVVLCLIMAVPRKGSTVVEHLPSNLKVKDSSLATDGAIGSGRWRKWWDKKV